MTGRGTARGVTAGLTAGATALVLGAAVGLPVAAAAAPRASTISTISTTSTTSLTSLTSAVVDRPAEASFVDVPPGSPFHDEITWMADRDLARGYADGTFRPTAVVSRQAAAAFFYRYLDVDWVPATTKQSFTDVPPGHEFHTEIEWMAARGMAPGYSDGTFRGTTPLSRLEIATIFYRLAGEPDVSLGSKTLPFADVYEETIGIEAITWMAFHHVSLGYADGSFGITEPVTRQAMAAFFHRFSQL